MGGHQGCHERETPTAFLCSSGVQGRFWPGASRPLSWALGGWGAVLGSGVLGGRGAGGGGGELPLRGYRASVQGDGHRWEQW